MAVRGTRQSNLLAANVSRFLTGLEERPDLRRRLARVGFSEQAYQELRACLARAGGAPREDATPPRRSSANLPTRARALAGWTRQQLATAGRASLKLPFVARDLLKILRDSGEDPETVLRRTDRLLQRVVGDEHLGHFVTLGGLRDAAAELRSRLEAQGDQQQMALSELAFLYAHWSRLSREVFQDDPSARKTLGID